MHLMGVRHQREHFQINDSALIHQRINFLTICINFKYRITLGDITHGKTSSVYISQDALRHFISKYI